MAPSKYKVLCDCTGHTSVKPALMGLYMRIFSFLFFFFKDFYLFDRDRDSQWEREHKQGEWKRKKQAHSGGAWCGARSQNTGITPWAEGRRLTAVPPRRPQKQILNSRGQTDGYQNGGRWCEGEQGGHWLWWAPGVVWSVESSYCTPEAYITLYVKYRI